MNRKFFIFFIVLMCFFSNGVYAYSSLERDGVLSNPTGYEETGYEIDGKGTDLIYQGKARSAGYDLVWKNVDNQKVMYNGNNERFGYGDCKKVIDVSLYNGTIDWSKVKNDGIDGAILRITSYKNGLHEDESFFQNLTGCRNNSMPFGVYLYSYATNSTEIKKEAQMMISILKKYDIKPSELTYPVYFDMESNDDTKELSVQQNIDNFTEFASILEASGYKVNIYSYTNYLQSNLSDSQLQKYVSWVAQYGKALEYKSNDYKGMFGWQYRSNGKVDGITGEVDISCFANYYGYDTDNHNDSTIGRDENQPYIKYQGNSQFVGWSSTVNEPNTIGTTGRNIPLYQIMLNLNNFKSDSYLNAVIKTNNNTYTYDKITNDTILGEDGNALQQVKFNLNNLYPYSIQYRVHSSNIGWQEWTNEGEYAGVLGNDIQAIDFRLITREVTYQTHIQDVGWQEWKKNGETSGTSNQSKRLEGINIKLTNNSSISGDIEYSTHIQDIGWQEWKKNGEMSGTSGQSKRLEAIKIKLTGTIAQEYDIYYRVHAQNIGWLDWAKNGQNAGTAGYGYRLEAIEIKLVEKNENAPGSTAKPYVQYFIGYSTHVQDVGWQTKVYDGTMSGTSGQAKRLEGITVNLDNQLYNGSVLYRTHIQDIGWQEWKENGEISGTSGQAKRLEAIELKLSGEMASKYDIYYRVHAQNFGWLGWAKNGESAGTEGFSYRLEGIEIQLIEKGKKAPGSTINHFYKS